VTGGGSGRSNAVSSIWSACSTARGGEPGRTGPSRALRGSVTVRDLDAAGEGVSASSASTRATLPGEGELDLAGREASRKRVGDAVSVKLPMGNSNLQSRRLNIYSKPAFLSAVTASVLLLMPFCLICCERGS